MEEHVGVCPGCQRVLDGLVGSLPDALAPSGPRERDTDEGPPALPGYEVLGRIDAGGMGVVWRVRDLPFDRDLAVKVMASRGRTAPHRIERFIAEAQICAQLTHPFIVPVHTRGRLEDGRPYYTMKLVEGRTLALLLEGGPAPAERRMEFVQIFDKVCQAVAFAHSRGVIHRDLKPENIMVGAHGEVQLMDWGLAKVLDAPLPGEGEDSVDGEASESLTTRTRAGSVMGTVAYMAPEQAQGRIEEVDRRSDVFGLGGILCRILSGEPPYTGPDTEAIRRQAAGADLGAALARLHGCGADPELIELAVHCLAPRQADRLADAAAVVARLAAYQTGVQERLRRAELERAAAQAAAKAERTARRRTRALAVAVLALVVLAAGGGLWAQHQAAERRAEQTRQENALRQEVAADLDQAIRFRQASHFDASLQQLEQIHQRLEDSGSADLRTQVEQCLADTTLARRLDDARLRTSSRVKGALDFAGAEQDYAAALREAGLGREGDAPAEVGERVRVCSVRAEVVAALDDWAGITSDDTRRAWLLAVARAADPDPERDRLRQPELWQDRETLMRLAQGPAAARMSPQLAIALGRALMARGGDAVPLLRQAQARHPDDFWLNVGLGLALSQAKQWDESAGYYRAALALRPRAPTVHNDLGIALFRGDHLEEAIHHYEEAIRLDPGHATSHYNLGIARNAQGQGEEALRHYEEALRLNPDLAPAHCNLGLLLERQGRYEEALAHLEQGHQLGSRQPGWTAPSAHWVRNARHLLLRHRKLPIPLPEEARSADATAQLDLARGYARKKQYALAARFAADAFAVQPRLAEDLQAGHRYRAVCAAALAGCGRGRDAARLRDADRARFRWQACEWLAINLDRRTRQFSRDRRAAQEALRHWLNDPDLADVRDPAALAQLPEGERQEWLNLWQQVERILGEAGK